MAARRPLLRVLGLHGYRQNERVFRERTGALRKLLRGRMELVCVSAPLLILGPETQAELDPQPDEPRGWWFSNPQLQTFDALEETDSCQGLEDTLALLGQVFAEQGPFDGVLGFSQGAALGAILCALKQRGDSRFPFHFAILVAGFKSRSVEHQGYYQDLISVPTLHVYGKVDLVIPGDMSQKLASCFREPVILTHQGGHFLPASAAQKNIYCQFLDTFLK
ncbi:esterase OVCA2 isoform X2 [Rhinatrema bivittatum]|uniref:esterase OVCA2 isoform X2 n=1 Tax=Rhinatrema bivittatum TaxID=194408 RepID=UPI00112CAF78|nr:esterase OVCA2 isoform X2 [Rhinatrema bivittatum]